MALLFAEKEYFNDERVAKAARKVKHEETHKQTAKDANLPKASCPLKWVALSSHNGEAQESSSGMVQYGSGLVTVNDGLSDNDSEGEDNRGTISDGPGTTSASQTKVCPGTSGHVPGLCRFLGPGTDGISHIAIHSNAIIWDVPRLPWVTGVPTPESAAYISIEIAAEILAPLLL
ncbi:hypothetical protein F5J12DRAFT_783952 [Pisolithus orientalis]|uniref:uncharacterized protein n=1 Tax=Pisolithus orientalis TaxID=936130 RepID=UPI00222486F2|nr:uncharacterized protein F5J12DRAFT_783952 [Pisolithus orientalis]KAI6002191.1 hypothetical protein F5J12DRAFT_783952 [Pisolithus orientalis]